LKLLGGALVRASGSIRLGRLDSRCDALAYRRLSFYCGGEAPALDWLTVDEWLDLHLSLYPGADTGQVQAQLDAFRIADIAAHPITGLSLGQYKKLQLALALSLPTRLLLVDEPFNGLDAHVIEVLVQGFRT
jgi:ABC-2 type transport system ATP-binding protein/heme exporter protein A